MAPSALPKNASFTPPCISSRTPPTPSVVTAGAQKSGVTSYGGYVNEHFQDEAINCTIKWAPGQPTAGIYAKRDILLNEELFTGYGKPQWIYTLRFFSHTLSPCTIQDATTRYKILPRGPSGTMPRQLDKPPLKSATTPTINLGSQHARRPRPSSTNEPLCTTANYCELHHHHQLLPRPNVTLLVF